MSPDDQKLMFVRCWFNVGDDAPTLVQHPLFAKIDPASPAYTTRCCFNVGPMLETMAQH